MKITKTQLKQIIKEELTNLKEGVDAHAWAQREKADTERAAMAAEYPPSGPTLTDEGVDLIRGFLTERGVEFEVAARDVIRVITPDGPFEIKLRGLVSREGA
jgi:hypothetical protein